MKSSVVIWQMQSCHDSFLKMYKTILVVCWALAVALAEYARNDDYIRLNRLQFKKTLDHYDTELAFLEKHNNGRAESAATQNELISAIMVQTEERLSPLLLLGGHFKKCVVKYITILPSLLVTKNTIATCESEASRELKLLLSAARATRDAFQEHIEEIYEDNLNGCAKDNDVASTNYTHCVTSATALTNSFTISNQKTFEAQLEAAVCTAKAIIRTLWDCTFTEQIRVANLISEVNFSVQNCLEGKDECRPCEAYTCSESYDLDVNSKSETIKNPFLGRDHDGCLMLNAKQN